MLCPTVYTYERYGMADYMGSSGVSEWFSGALVPVVGKFIPNAFVFVVMLVVVIWIVRLFFQEAPL